MNHKDHVFLLNKIKPKGIWADFGSGWGAFSLALRDLGGEEIVIYSIDKNESSLNEQKINFKNKFLSSKIFFIKDDFTKPISLPKLDGILMANSLHYVKEQTEFLKFIKRYLKPNGIISIVEYNTDISNIWLPYPLSYNKFLSLANSNYINSELLASLPQEFGGEIYCARSFAIN